jgi:lipopolysaccharide transport system ATP-binding protein
MSSEIAIKVKNLGKCYQIYDHPQDRLKQSIYPRLQKIIGMAPKSYCRNFWALNDVSFAVKKGETLGIIGLNGSGKSTLLQLICGTLAPSSGSVETKGRISALLELGSGFNQDFTGRENVYMNGAILGLTRDEIDARFDSIAAFADIGEFIEQPVKTYSSGMLVRLAFAVSVCVEPDILVVDEALAVGDMAFQQKCLQRLGDLRETGTTILLVTHDILLTRNYCSRVVYLDHGVVKQIGEAETVGEAYIKDTVSKQQASSRTAGLSWRQGAGKLAFGTSSGRIVDVSLSCGGSPGYVVNYGDTLTVSVKAIVLKDIQNPELIVQVRDSRGYIIYGIKTGVNDLRKQPLNDEVAVSAALDFRIILHEGDYAITVGLVDRRGDLVKTVLDKVIAAVSFSVFSSDKNRFHGLLDLNGRWHK